MWPFLLKATTKKLRVGPLGLHSNRTYFGNRRSRISRKACDHHCQHIPRCGAHPWGQMLLAWTSRQHNGWSSGSAAAFLASTGRTANLATLYMLSFTPRNLLHTPCFTASYPMGAWCPRFINESSNSSSTHNLWSLIKVWLCTPLLQNFDGRGTWWAIDNGTCINVSSYHFGTIILSFFLDWDTVGRLPYHHNTHMMSPWRNLVPRTNMTGISTNLYHWFKLLGCFWGIFTTLAGGILHCMLALLFHPLKMLLVVYHNHKGQTFIFVISQMSDFSFQVLHTHYRVPHMLVNLCTISSCDANLAFKGCMAVGLGAAMEAEKQLFVTSCCFQPVNSLLLPSGMRSWLG